MQTMKEAQQKGLRLQDGNRVGEQQTYFWYKEGKLYFYHFQAEDAIECEIPKSLGEVANILDRLYVNTSLHDKHWKNALLGVVGHLRRLSSTKI